MAAGIRKLITTGSEFWPVLRNEEVIVAIIDSLKDEATDVQKVGLVLKKLAKQGMNVFFVKACAY